MHGIRQVSNPNLDLSLQVACSIKRRGRSSTRAHHTASSGGIKPSCSVQSFRAAGVIGVSFGQRLYDRGLIIPTSHRVIGWIVVALVTLQLSAFAVRPSLVRAKCPQQALPDQEMLLYRCEFLRIATMGSPRQLLLAWFILHLRTMLAAHAERPSSVECRRQLCLKRYL